MSGSQATFDDFVGAQHQGGCGESGPQTNNLTHDDARSDHSNQRNNVLLLELNAADLAHRRQVSHR